MTIRQINLILWATTAACCIGAVASIIVAVSLPLSNADEVSQASQAVAAAAPVNHLPPVATLEAAWNAPLQPTAPIANPPTSADAQAATADASPHLTLVGTIGTKLALLQLPSGQVEVKAIGESAGGAEVIAIRPSQVDVKIQGRVVTLDKPKPPTPRP